MSQTDECGDTYNVRAQMERRVEEVSVWDSTNQKSGYDVTDQSESVSPVLNKFIPKNPEETIIFQYMHSASKNFISLMSHDTIRFGRVTCIDWVNTGEIHIVVVNWSRNGIR